MAEHKMKDLGVKQKEFYGGDEINKSPDKIVYREIDLPLALVEGMDASVDDEVTVTIKGRISGLQDTKFAQTVTIEAKQGEVIKGSKKKEE